MGDPENPQQRLPEGWKTEVKLRKDGNKEKFYISPSGAVELQSKLKVLRYLEDTEDTLAKEDDGKQNKAESAWSKKKVVFEKATPDGLPLGWTKEVKITKNGRKIRRDPYYTDPVTGYIFRSMKDVLRYINTGDLGRLAFKPKDKKEIDVEVEDADTSTPVVTKKQKLEEEEASSLTAEESRLKSCGPEKDELTQNSTSPGGLMPVHDHTCDQCGLSAGISSPDLPVAEGVNPSNGESDAPTNNTKDQLNANIDSSSGEFSATPAAELLPGQLPIENGVCGDKSKSPAPIPAAELLPGEHPMGNEVGGDKSNSRKRGRSMKKKDFSMPRRASKRLAGVPLDGVLELKTKSRTRRVVPEHSDDMAGIVAEDTLSHQTDALVEAMGSSGNKHHAMRGVKHSNDNVGTQNQIAEKGKVERQGDEIQEFATASLLAVQAGIEERPDRVGSDVYIDQEPELPLDVLLGELWQDPCIAFAIQTLTGSSFDNSHGELKYSATSDYAVPENPSEVADIISKANDEAASPRSIPPADAWSDPCIEFAIKTLTDAIPLEYGLVIQGFLPQQSISWQSQPSSGEFCQTKFLSQPFGASSSRPTFNQAGYVEPALPLPGNTISSYPGRASHQRSDERSKKRAR